MPGRQLSLAMGIVGMCWPLVALAQNPTVNSEMNRFVESAGEYAISISGRQLELNPKPILHWTNPARSNERGGVFLWMNEGRPEVIASCFTYGNDGQIFERHEFHSLSVSPLDAAIENRSVWKPSAGIRLQTIPGAQKPATSPARRKLQMKLLARRFSATMQTDAELTHLRLLPSPLASYEPQDQACLSGAIFSFAVGTDPEVLLLIECRHDANDNEPVWKYGFARYHYWELTAKLDDKKVWSAPNERDEHFADRSQFQRIRTKLYASYGK